MPSTSQKETKKQFRYDFVRRFDGYTTADQVLHGVDLSSKRVLITGANAGIGFETAKSLAKAGCEVILACRSYPKMKEAMTQIKREVPTASLDFVQLDLESLRSVRNCANEIIHKFDRLGCLICNAGLHPRFIAQTEDNFERTFQVNHLAQFYLILLLKPLLLAGSLSRIVILGSEAHRASLLTKENISEEYLSPRKAKRFVACFMAYNDSKLCNSVIAAELHRRWGREKISCNSLHPGTLISTDISRHWWVFRLGMLIARPFTKSLQQGAATTVWTATAEELTGISGQYMNNGWLCAPSDKVHNEELGKALWSLSIEMLERVVGPIPGISEEKYYDSC